MEVVSQNTCTSATGERNELSNWQIDTRTLRYRDFNLVCIIEQSIYSTAPSVVQFKSGYLFGTRTFTQRNNDLEVSPRPHSPKSNLYTIKCIACLCQNPSTSS